MPKMQKYLSGRKRTLNSPVWNEIIVETAPSQATFRKCVKGCHSLEITGGGRTQKPLKYRCNKLELVVSPGQNCISPERE